MSYLEEKRELVKSISQLEQAIGQSTAKILTLRLKVEAARVAYDRCVYLRDTSRETLDCMKKTGVVVEINDYQGALGFYKHNRDLASNHKTEVFMYQKKLDAEALEVSSLERVLENAIKMDASTAIILPFER